MRIIGTIIFIAWALLAFYLGYKVNTKTFIIIMISNILLALYSILMIYQGV